MRLKLRPNAWLNDLTISVLPRPGTPSISTWPPAKKAVRTLRTTSRWPTMTRPTSSSIEVNKRRKSRTRSSGGVMTPPECGVHGQWKVQAEAECGLSKAHSEELVQSWFGLATGESSDIPKEWVVWVGPGPVDLL